MEPSLVDKISFIELVNFIIGEWKDKNKIKITKEKKSFKEAHLLSLNINKSKKELNWRPVLDFQNTIKFTVNWYKKFYKKENMKKFSLIQIKKFEKLKKKNEK